MRAAEQGDRHALTDAIAKRESAGDLSTGEAAALAKAVVDHDLRVAGPSEATSRVRDARPCARELDGALADRMRIHDDAGAEAALARIEGRGLALEDARAYLADADAHWRAVGTRGLVRPEDRTARLRALLDPEPLVRREAARAARDAADTADVDALAEAARLDPEPIVRTEAVRAIAALPPLPGDAVADALRDLWIVGDDALRGEIAVAWSGAALWSAGGRDALRAVIASESGPEAIEAAAAVLRRRDADAAVAVEAVSHLVRAITSGSSRERLAALALAPLDRKELANAARTASEEDDLEIRVGALAALAIVGDSPAARALEQLATPGSPVAARARFALASVGDRRIQAWIEQDLVSVVPADRLDAGLALATLGVAGRAAPLLSDADASVRVRAACAIVTAARITAR